MVITKDTKDFLRIEMTKSDAAIFYHGLEQALQTMALAPEDQTRFRSFLMDLKGRIKGNDTNFRKSVGR